MLANNCTTLIPTHSLIYIGCCGAAEARQLLRAHGDRAPRGAAAIPSGRPLAAGAGADARRPGHNQQRWHRPVPRSLRASAYGYERQYGGVAPLGAPYLSSLFYGGSAQPGGIYAATAGQPRAADPLSPAAQAPRPQREEFVNEFGFAPQFG